MWALIPIKPFRLAKTRLASRLSDAARCELARAMARDVMNAVVATSKVERVIVCSSDPEAGELARAHGCAVIEEAPHGDGLNAAVGSAIARLKAWGAERLMVVHGDLPLLTCREVDAFATSFMVDPDRILAIAPDRRDDGTNMIAWSLRHPFQPRYGPASFSHHREQARYLGLLALTCRLAGAAADLDTPDDLDYLMTQRACWGGHSRAVLRNMENSPCPELSLPGRDGR